MFSHAQHASFVLAGTGYMVGLITDRVTTGDLLVVVAAVVFAAATWRSGTRKTLSEDNTALRGRVQTLEEEVVVKGEEIKLLVDTLATERTEQTQLRHELKNELAVANMKTDLTGHEAAETERHKEIVAALASMQTAFDEMVRTLKDLRAGSG